MPKLAVVSGEELIKLLVRKGYSIRSRRGSHVNLIHPTLPALTVPLHKELKKGLLHHVLNSAKIDPSEL